MTEVRCLCEQCKMTVMQCRGRSAKSDAVLEKSVAWLETNVPHFSPHLKKWYLKYMQRQPTKAELQSQHKGA